METSKVYVKINENDRRRLPPTEPSFDPLQRLVSAFDRVTQHLRDGMNSRTRDVQQHLKNNTPDLSEHYREALVADLQGLRQRINDGGLEGLLATGRAAIHCILLRNTPTPG